jgi:hypothetical protein
LTGDIKNRSASAFRPTIFTKPLPRRSRVPFKKHCAIWNSWEPGWRRVDMPGVASHRGMWLQIASPEAYSFHEVLLQKHSEL